MDAAARRGPAGVLRRTCLILGLLAGHTCAISSSSNNLLHLHQMPLSRGPGAHGWSSPSPEGSPLASPCSSTTNMARVQQFGSDACQQRALGKAMPSNPLRCDPSDTPPDCPSCALCPAARCTQPARKVQTLIVLRSAGEPSRFGPTWRRRARRSLTSRRTRAKRCHGGPRTSEPPLNVPRVSAPPQRCSHSLRHRRSPNQWLHKRNRKSQPPTPEI